MEKGEEGEREEVERGEGGEREDVGLLREERATESQPSHTLNKLRTLSLRQPSASTQNSIKDP